MKQILLFRACRQTAMLCVFAVVAGAQMPIEYALPASVANTWQTGPSYGVGLSDRYAFDSHSRLVVAVQPDGLTPAEPPSAVWWKLISIERDPYLGDPPAPEQPPGGEEPAVPPTSGTENSLTLEPHITPELSTSILLGSGMLMMVGALGIRRLRA